MRARSHTGVLFWYFCNIMNLLEARAWIGTLRNTCERLLLKFFTLDKKFSKSNYKDIFSQMKVSERFLKEENNKWHLWKLLNFEIIEFCFDEIWKQLVDNYMKTVNFQRYFFHFRIAVLKKGSLQTVQFLWITLMQAIGQWGINRRSK